MLLYTHDNVRASLWNGAASLQAKLSGERPVELLPGVAMAIASIAWSSICTIVAVSCMAACSAPKPPAPPTTIAARVAPVTSQSVPVTAEYVAQTQALQQVDLVARVQGVLEKIYFKNGSLVRQGQVLMQIQPDEYEAQVQAAQGSLQKARADLMRAKSNVQDQTAKAKLSQALAAYEYQKVELARMRPLAAKHAVSQKDYDQTKTQYDIAVANVQAARANVEDVELNQETGILSAQGNVAEAQAQLQNAQLNLSYTKIVAPVTGIISFANVDEGNVVGPKTPSLATVSTIDPTRVVFQLSEADYLKVAQRLPAMRGRVGPALQLYLSDGSRYPYDGRATNINRAVDPTTGTISVESLFPNPNAFLRPGQYTRVRFPISQQRNALLIPQSAVTSYQGTTVVYVLGPGNKLQLRTIDTGSQYGNRIVVNSGVKKGDSVVLSPNSRMQAGTVVTPIRTTASGNE